MNKDNKNKQSERIIINITDRQKLKKSNVTKRKNRIIKSSEKFLVNISNRKTIKKSNKIKKKKLIKKISLCILFLLLNIFVLSFFTLKIIYSKTILGIKLNKNIENKNKNINLFNKNNNNPENTNNSQKGNSNIIDSNELMIEVAKLAQDFVDKSSKGILISSIPSISNTIPKVSVVIPLYNCKKTIKRAIRSIQNQNFADFEIILVNDFSKDETINIINTLKNEDLRITIINNKKNMGILYTRCIGALAAKGKYIFPLDNDDLFLVNDTIDIIYNEINNNNYDTLYFKGISISHFHDFFRLKNMKVFRSYPTDTILHQPELGDYALTRMVLWGQCIKTELYQRAVNAYGEERYSKYVTFYEDGIIHFIINQFATTSKLFTKYGILHIDRPWSAAKSVNPIIKRTSEIYYIESLFEFSKNVTYIKEKVATQLIQLMNKQYFDRSINNINNKKYFEALIKKMISSQFINDTIKESLKKKCSKFNINI